ncbi:histidine phosphatase family protein [Pseudomonas knackmussii]|uniref:lipopolysaccharide core heptose(II)-phosphate phosphatase PmrG n=1 Tax=Pseudomonas knackmussii TaxID=65741 RepID=UPI003F4A53AB
MAPSIRYAAGRAFRIIAREASCEVKSSPEAGRDKRLSLFKSRPFLAALLGGLGLLALGLGGAASFSGERDLKQLGPADLAAQWSHGDVVVLVRHAERCDRSSAPCMGAKDGITVRGGEMASTVGRDYRTFFGLDNADIYASPLTRTTQTADLMFGNVKPDQWWAADCKGKLLDNVLAHKANHRNLILVTHSECMEQLVQALDHHDIDTPDYASSLVLASDGKGGLQVVGKIDPDDWSKTQQLSQR